MNLASIYQRADGGLSISTIVRDKDDGESDQDFADAAFRRVEAINPGGVRVGLFDTSIIDAMYLTDGDFRDAWRISGGALAVDLGAAKTITVDRIRVAREAAFVALDVAYLRAMESGASVDDIVAEKQRLRDLPAAVATAGSISELRALRESV